MDAFSAFLGRPALTRWDLLDIAIVAVLVYQALLLIRGTRAVQMALSGGFLIGLFFLSEWLELETVNWVIRNLASYVVVAIIVLFQADIRRALAHFGRAPVLSFLTGSDVSAETIEELAAAARHLSKERTGALIVIERHIGLRNYIEGGNPLDASVTFDLLNAIFHKQSPLHDGAVIVQGNRIAAAACLLPLSVTSVSREFGTRHRAALGLTEENDAIAIVVSEETGKVSLAIEGRFERDFEKPEPEGFLELRLRTLLGVRMDRFDWLQRWSRRR